MGLLSGTFGVEEIWLRRALKQVRKDPFCFARKNVKLTQQELGMGNKQIHALSDWLLSSNFVIKRKGSKMNQLQFTDEGMVVANYDPDLSEDGSFWIAHYFWSLDTNRLWFYHWYVNEFENSTFSRKDIEIGLQGLKNTSSKVINDFGILPLLQTMRKTRLGTSFGMMIENSPNQFKRIEPPEDRLEPIIVAYITMDWAKRNDRGSASLLELTSSKCSPGKVLHLSARRYSDYLDEITAMFAKEILWVSHTAGLNSVAFERGVEALDVLKAYYIRKRDEINPLDSFRRAQRECLKQ